MGKILVVVLLVVLPIIANPESDIFSTDKDCIVLYKELNINPNTKSRKGWIRVFKSNPKMIKKGLITCVKDNELKQVLKNCIDNFLIKKNKSYNQNLGEEL